MTQAISGLSMKELTDLFRGREYEKALIGYLQQWDCQRESREPGSPKQKLIILARIVDCYSFIPAQKGASAEEWDKALATVRGYFATYVEVLDSTPKADVAEDVVMDVYDRLLHLLFAPGTCQDSRWEASVREAGDAFEALMTAGRGKVERDYGYNRWLSSAEGIRREGIGRPDLVSVVRALRTAFLKSVKDQADPRSYGEYRSLIDNLLADTVYFFPKSAVPAEERWKEVEECLKDSLTADPKNLFASEFLANLNRVRNTSRQIAGFLHDINSRIADLKAHMSSLRAADTAGVLAHTLEALGASIETLGGIAGLVQVDGHPQEPPPRGSKGGRYRGCN